MKDKFFYITIVVFILTLGITGFLYYRLSLTTVGEYDNELTESRNEVILQIDTLSNTLNTAEDTASIDTEIQSLESKRETLNQKFGATKKPDRGGEEIVQLNQDFLNKTGEIITIAREYKDSFTQDEIDPIKKLNSYNTKVSELNTIIESIKSTLENSDNRII